MMPFIAHKWFITSSMRFSGASERRNNNSNTFICLFRQTYTIHTGNYINMINDTIFSFLFCLLMLLLCIAFVLSIRALICESKGWRSVACRLLARPPLAISFLFKFNRFDQFYAFVRLCTLCPQSTHTDTEHIFHPMMTPVRINIARSTDSVSLKY